MQNDPSTSKILIIDDEENMRHMLGVLFRKSGYRVDTAADGHEGLQRIDRTRYDFIFCDVRMPQMDGMAFLKAAQEKINGTTVIMMSAYGTIDNAVEAMKLGAYDYISKPFKTDEIRLVLQKAEEREKLQRENLQLKQRLLRMEADRSFSHMVGKSRVLQSIFRLTEKVAQYNTTVLITGESGTGKELIARGLHALGPRAAKPLVILNCGSIPENLLESEFFGYRKGAFTGADQDRPGYFEEADGGSLFLDEIGELPLALQVKLLRVLQENEIRPLGDSQIKKIDVRVIAATAKDLEHEIRHGRFREDLYYRLNVLPVRLPPLRERMEDIPLLVRHFIEKFTEQLQKDTRGVSPEALSLLMNYRWPGNVRELENMIERAMVLSEDSILQPESFPRALVSQGHLDFSELDKQYSLKEAQKALERRLIVRALQATGGNRTQASRLLEISHPSLLSKIKTYDIAL